MRPGSADRLLDKPRRSHSACARVKVRTRNSFFQLIQETTMKHLLRITLTALFAAALLPAAQASGLDDEWELDHNMPTLGWGDEEPDHNMPTL